MSKTTIPTAGLADDAVDLTSKVTGTLPIANGGTAITSNLRLVTDNHYTLVDVKDYHETDTYTTTSSTIYRYQYTMYHLGFIFSRS